MISVNVIFSVSMVLIIYLMAMKLFGRAAALAGFLLFTFSPVFWFYGEVTAIYTAEAFHTVDEKSRRLIFSLEEISSIFFLGSSAIQ